jgi:hypothetical protein
MEGTGRGGADRRDPCQGGGTRLAVTVGIKNQVAEEEDVSGRAWGPWSSEGEAAVQLPRGLYGKPRGGTPRVEVTSICISFLSLLSLHSATHMPVQLIASASIHRALLSQAPSASPAARSGSASRGSRRAEARSMSV